MIHLESGKAPEQAPKWPNDKAEDKEKGGLAATLAAALPDRLRFSILRRLGNFAVLVTPRIVGKKSSAILRATFHQSCPTAYGAYRIFNQNYPRAEQQFYEELIAKRRAK